jgi:hypothetical protein
MSRDIGECWDNFDRARNAELKKVLDGLDPSWIDWPTVNEHMLRALDGELRALNEAEALGGEPGDKPRRVRKPRKPTLVSVAKQASKAAIEVARYEVKPDGTVTIVTGKSEATEANPWLDDLKVTKQ